MSYAEPNANVTREHHVNNLTGVASASMVKMLNFQKCRLRGVVSEVITSGTNAAAGVDIFVGTNSVGSITHGTAAAGVNQNSGTLNAFVPSGEPIELRGKANSATMVNSYVFIRDVFHDDAATISSFNG